MELARMRRREKCEGDAGEMEMENEESERTGTESGGK